MEIPNLIFPLLLVCLTVILNKYMDLHYQKNQNNKLAKLEMELVRLKDLIGEIDKEEIDRLKSQVNGLVVRKGLGR